MATTFDDFVLARRLALTRYAYVLCGDRHLAEDLTQTALERCYRRWRLTGGLAAHPEAYVRRAIANAFVSSRRGPAGRLVVVEEPRLPASGDTTGPAAEHDLLWRALAGLAPMQRAVLVLRYYEDLDDPSIARVIGCARGTVRSSASRALAALRLDPTITQQEAER